MRSDILKVDPETIKFVLESLEKHTTLKWANGSVPTNVNVFEFKGKPGETYIVVEFDQLHYGFNEPESGYTHDLVFLNYCIEKYPKEETKHGCERLEETARNKKKLTDFIGSGFDFTGMSSKEISELLEEELSRKPEKTYDVETTNKEFDKICAEISELVKNKNERYGDDNLTKFGHLGIIIRMYDKLSRLENLTKAGCKSLEEFNKLKKSIEGQYIDVAGYAVNALRLMRGGRI
jgi:ubiquitin